MNYKIAPIKLKSTGTFFLCVTLVSFLFFGGKLLTTKNLSGTVFELVLYQEPEKYMRQLSKNDFFNFSL